MASGQPTTSASTLYTVPASTSSIVRHISVVNTNASSTVTVTIWQGGSTDANMILPPTIIVAGGSADFSGIITLAAADTIQYKADTATRATVTVHGMEIS